jgi:hypothetical protein
MDHQNNTKETDSNGSFTCFDSRQLRREIITEKIYPAYLSEVDNNLFQRKLWSGMFTVFSSLTVILMSASTIVSFSAPQFPNAGYVSYIAGILGVGSLMCKTFGHFAMVEGSTSTQRVNILLKSIGINELLPDTITTAPNLSTGNENNEEDKSLQNSNIPVLSNLSRVGVARNVLEETKKQ